ncbi:SRPBCC family protein [Jiangella asiatica]|uniref:SRPBCC family protein n=1 Tax=Jiangella asiatica TaxID=2530372 RepID=A0A4R5CXT6_9ACTN|nr:SRPBCC family protein [Jiangella asiatica]TDE03384.1 SRPBCC family protein [Jiangella asiatica]
MKDRHRAHDRLARALGWASLGLAVPLLTAPNRVARATGADDSPAAPVVIRTTGVRELGHAAALLAGPPRMVWTRVAGDVVDLAVIALALPGRDGLRRRRLAVTMAGVGAVTVLDVYAAVDARRANQFGAGRPGPLKLSASITVNRDPSEAYAIWRDFERLPSFMRHVRSVTPRGDRLWHWVVSAPIGRTVEWDAELTGDDAGRRISWRSVPGGDVDNSGTVHFAPASGERGTEVRVVLHYDVPGGMVGTALATAVGEEPEQQVRDDLRRFKQVVETGRVTRSDAMPWGADAARQALQPAAQPHPDRVDERP